MDRHPDPQRPRPYDAAHGDELRFDALANGTLRNLWWNLKKWVVPASLVGGGNGPAFASAVPVSLAVSVAEAQEALKPWFELEDQLVEDVERYGCAFTLTTRSGTRRVEPWRVVILMAQDTPVRGGHVHVTTPNLPGALA